MGQFQDLTNYRFERLLVLSRSGAKPDGRVTWNCKCDCGNLIEVVGKQLKNGERKSCGCLKKEMDAARVVPGRSDSNGKENRTHYIWRGMIDRCHRETEKSYKWYGAKGITVCDRWRESFSNFLEDMGEAPGDKTIERIDNSKGYMPENCKWATAVEQARNKSSNKFLEYQGQRLCISEWAERLGMDKSTIQKRLDSGWDAERALSTPVKQLRRRAQ